LEQYPIASRAVPLIDFDALENVQSGAVLVILSL
jgi:hypothetical protein